MNDRTFLLVIVCLIGIGYYSYQKVLQGQGGIKPLSELLSPGSKEDKEDQLLKKLNGFELQQRFANLHKEVDESKKTKENFLKDRRERISALIEINADLYNQVRDYILIVSAKQDDFNGHNDLLNDFFERVVGLAEKPLGEERMTLFGQDQVKVMDLIQKLLVHPDQEIDIINKALIEVSEMLASPFDSIQWGCPSLADCLNENMQVVSSQVKYYAETKIRKPLKQLEDLTELNQMLDHELRFLMANTDGSKQAIENNNSYLENDIEAHFANLNEFKIDALKQIIRSFEWISQEQKIVLSNLTDHEGLFLKRYIYIRNLLKTIISQLQNSPAFDFSPLAENFNANRINADASLALLQNNVGLFHEAMAFQLDKTEQVIKELAVFVDVDLLALKQELGLVDSQKLTSSLPSQLMNASLGKEIDQESIQKNRIVTTEEDVELMRLKAKQDEKLLQSMLEVYGSGAIE